MTENPHPFEVLTQHPLSEITRRDRRSLLAASSISILLMWTGTFPTQIAALGMSFPSDRRILVSVLGLVNLYLLFLFAASSLTDFANWRHRVRVASSLWLTQNPDKKLGERLLRKAIAQALHQVPLLLETKPDTQAALLTQYLDDQTSFWRIAYQIAPSAALKAIILEFILPVFLGLCAVCMLLPWWSMAAIVATTSLVGIPLGYRTTRLEVSPHWRALSVALTS